MIFILKNYVKEGQKLPMFGVGPYLIYGIAILNAIVIILSVYVFKVGILEEFWIYLFRIVGALLIILGITIWFIGAIKSDMDESISENKLKTDGIYSWVRNPMYSGCWFITVGVSFMWHNWLLVPMIFVDWLIMTIVLKNTEEKWLLELYGQEYADYKKRVNRCIPWKSSSRHLAVWIILGIIAVIAGIVWISLTLYTSTPHSYTIIGGADGPTSIFLAGKISKETVITSIAGGMVLIVVGITLIAIKIKNSKDKE